MIVCRFIKIKLDKSNIDFYRNLGFDNIKGDEIEIPIEFLKPNSHRYINCKCDNCEIIKKVMFKNYIKYKNKWGNYLCRKCSEFKRKKTLMINIGVEYPNQIKKLNKK